MLRALARDGWYVTRQRSHTILAHPTKRGIIPVPRHRRSLKPGTVHNILKSAGLTEDEFKALL
jgi:predicted RNA binding protein YcfA (HicA-like mRNA interferase family)